VPNGGLNSILSRQSSRNGQIPRIQYPVSWGWKNRKISTCLRTLSKANEELEEIMLKRSSRQKWSSVNGTSSSSLETYSKLIKPKLRDLFNEPTIYLGGDRPSRGKDLAMKSNLPQWNLWAFTSSDFWVKKSSEANKVEICWKLLGGVELGSSLSYKKKKIDNLPIYPKNSQTTANSPPFFSSYISEQRVEDG